MAGIEKICEYSHEYPDGDMYAYKRNHIQVLPKYRPLFKGQPHTLYVKLKWFKKGSWDPDEVCTGKVAEYEYILHVPGLPGEVKGCYLNWSGDIRAVKHKLRKLLGLRSITQLNIVKINDANKFDDKYDELIGH
jgi:hypothetical protein